MREGLEVDVTNVGPGPGRVAGLVHVALHLTWTGFSSFLGSGILSLECLATVLV